MVGLPAELTRTGGWENKKRAAIKENPREEVQYEYWTRICFICFCCVCILWMDKLWLRQLTDNQTGRLRRFGRSYFGGDLRTGIIIGGTLTLVYGRAGRRCGDSGQCHDGDDGNDGSVHYYRRRNGNGDCDRGSGFRYGSAGPDGGLDDQHTVNAYCG